MAVYVCSKCKFAFERSGDADQCPDCGRENVRFATDDEVAEYKRNREEAAGNAGCAEGSKK